jgi:hypothetical protein
MTEAVNISETSVNFYHATRRTYQKTAIFISATVRTLNLTLLSFLDLLLRVLFLTSFLSSLSFCVCLHYLFALLINLINPRRKAFSGRTECAHSFDLRDVTRHGWSRKGPMLNASTNFN